MLSVCDLLVTFHITDIEYIKPDDHLNNSLHVFRWGCVLFVCRHRRRMWADRNVSVVVDGMLLRQTNIQLER